MLMMLGSAARVRYMNPAAPHAKLEVRRGTRALPSVPLSRLLLEDSIWTAFTPTPCQDHYHYGKDGMLGCQIARIVPGYVRY